MRYGWDIEDICEPNQRLQGSGSVARCPRAEKGHLSRGPAATRFRETWFGEPAPGRYNVGGGQAYGGSVNQGYAQLCRQARGSLYEVRDHLTTCVEEGYLEITEGERLDKLAQSVACLLNGYVRSTLARKHDER